jgi:hypothetical protein
MGARKHTPKRKEARRRVRRALKLPATPQGESQHFKISSSVCCITK